MADDRDGDFEQCTPSQKDSPKGSQRHSGSNLSDGERMIHRRVLSRSPGKRSRKGDMKY